MGRKSEDVLARLLSLPMLALLVMLGSIPLLWPVAAKYEGVWFPVVVPIMHANETPDDLADDYPLPIVAAEFSSPANEPPYVDVYVQFDKVRSCDFLTERRVIDGEEVTVNLSLTWYDVANRRMLVEFEPDHMLQPATRPEGLQVAGPWRIHGTRSAQGTAATVAHRCHPLWLTYSRFHP